MKSLTVSSIDDCIDKVLTANSGESDEQWFHYLKVNGFRLQRATTPQEWKSLLEFVSAASGDTCSAPAVPDEVVPSPIPYFFGIGLYSLHGAQLCGVVTFYMAYSTWDGRFLFIDRLDSPSLAGQEDMEKAMLRPLAKIAVELDCARLTWRGIDIPTWYEKDSLPPEILYGWLTLRMERSAMVKYTGVPSEEDTKSVDFPKEMMSFPVVHDSMQECLAAVNGASDSKFRFRLSTGDDVDTIARLVQGLAVYEKEPDAVNVTAEHYRCDGGSSEPLFYCLLLDDAKSQEEARKSCGMALVYFGYELGKGRFLYLEDLYLEEVYRKRGGGSLTMKSLARISLALGCQNFYWVALDWNTPALNLYEKIGARVQKGVQTVRFTDEKLRSFAAA